MSSAYQKQCPRCGTLSTLAASQCGECGHLFRTRFRKQCPSCSTAADLDATYCRNCGRLYRTPFPAANPTPAPRPEPVLPLLMEVPVAPGPPAPELPAETPPEPEPYLVPPGILSQIFTPNPWLDLVPSRTPYFASIDRAALEHHHAAASDEARFDGSVPPLPFLGDPQAPILLLDASPSLPTSLRRDPAAPAWAERWTANLHHAPLAYPLFLVDPVLGQQFGSGSLARSLAYWLAVYGAERVSRWFFLVHHCPYTAPSFPEPVTLPSQAYSLELARTKVRSGCLTLMLGGGDRWEALIPELKTSGHQVLRPGRRSLSPPHGKRSGNLSAETVEALHRVLGSEG